MTEQSTEQEAGRERARFTVNGIADIIADGYDISQDTYTIAEAVFWYVEAGDPNPFKAEADVIHGVEREAGESVAPAPVKEPSDG